jgi:hypothetical protein
MNNKINNFGTTNNYIFKVNENKPNILYIKNDVIDKIKKYNFLKKINANQLDGIIKLKKYSIFKCDIDIDIDNNNNPFIFLENINNNILFKDEKIIFEEKSTKQNFQKNNYLNLFQKLIEENINENINPDEEEYLFIFSEKFYKDDNSTIKYKNNKINNEIKNESNNEENSTDDKKINNLCHTAFVLYKDEESFITLENDIKNCFLINDFKPIFKIYKSKNYNKNNFHNEYKNLFIPNPKTIVLQKKYIENTVLYNLNIKLKSIDSSDEDKIDSPLSIEFIEKNNNEIIDENMSENIDKNIEESNNNYLNDNDDINKNINDDIESGYIKKNNSNDSVDYKNINNSNKINESYQQNNDNFFISIIKKLSALIF